MIRLKEIRFQYCNEYYTCMSGFLWSWLRKEKAAFQGQGSFLQNVLKIVVENLGKSQEICFLVADTFQLE